MSNGNMGDPVIVPPPQAQVVPIPHKKRKRRMTPREMAFAGRETPGQVYARPVPVNGDNGNKSAIGNA